MRGLMLVAVLMFLVMAWYFKAGPKDKAPEKQEAPLVEPEPVNEATVSATEASNQIAEIVASAVETQKTAPVPVAPPAEDPVLAEVREICRLQSQIMVPHELGELKDLKGRVYTKVMVTRLEPDGICFKHSSGSAKLVIGNLPADLAERYHIKPATAAYYAEEIARRRQAQSASQAELAQVRQEQERQEDALRRSQEEADRERLASQAAERQRAAYATAWAQYRSDMSEYHRKCSEITTRKMYNRNLVVRYPLEPKPPSVPDPGGSHGGY